jgi:predicted PurR-regulated permease PerM
MAFQLPVALTWRNLFKASFLAIGDAALIAMIKDQSFGLLAAMVLASVIGFVALVKEDWLRAKHPWAFQTILVVSGVVFAGFVAFAMTHAYQQSAINEKLDNFRSEGLSLEMRTQNGMNAFEYGDWQKQLTQWNDGTAAYLKKKIGDVAKNRFLSSLGYVGLSYGGNTPEFNQHLNMLVNHGKNLQEIIDGRSRFK